MMKKQLWYSALLLAFIIGVPMVLATPAVAGDFQPELAFGKSAVALEGSLENVRGKGAEDEVMDHLLSATLAGNSSSNSGSITANNSILDSSFAGSSGFLTVIQNAADNVIIQTNTSLTVNFHP